MQWRNIDVIDEAWLKDYLSDDDIELPKEMQHGNEEEEDDEEDDELQNEQKQAWNDLGLDRFVQDVQRQQQEQQLQLQQQAQQQVQQQAQQQQGQPAAVQAVQPQA